MSTKASDDYLLLFRRTDWDHGLSAEETRAVIDSLNVWLGELSRKGLLKAGQPLGETGRTISGKGRATSDGPFAESKEVVGGYLIVRARSLDEATEIARAYPCLDYGATVEVRPIAENCPTMQRVNARLALVDA